MLKFRGVRFRGGYHDYIIQRGGIEVYPRLVASEHRTAPVMEKLASGIAEMDTLLGGGIERGTSTLIVGAAGTGKSSLAAQFVAAAAARGQNVGHVHLRRERQHAAARAAPAWGSTCGSTWTPGR